MKAFTLIELILTTAIVLVMGTFSSVFYSRFFQSSSVDLTVDRVVGTFRKAQIYSMEGRLNDTWAVNYATSSAKLTLFKGKPPFATRDSHYDEVFLLGSNMVVTGWASDIYFNRMTGTPSATRTITVTGGKNVSIATISAQGVVSR
jgi:hypothetical protein